MDGRDKIIPHCCREPTTAATATGRAQDYRQKETSAVPVAPVAPAAPVEVVVPPPTPAVPANSQKPASTGGSKTILKPGAHTLTGTKAGLVLKGQPEKPTLVAKPSAPTPVKSPWATLPPIEKTPPVQINPPIPQQPPPRFPPREIGRAHV